MRGELSTGDVPLRLARSRPGEPQTPETCVRERTQLTSHIIMPLTAVATDPAASRQFSRVEYNLLNPGTGQACSCGSPTDSQRVRRYSTHSLCCRDCALLRRRTPPGHGSKSCILYGHRQIRDGSCTRPWVFVRQTASETRCRVAHMSTTVDRLLVLRTRRT